MDHYCISVLKSMPHVDSLKLATKVFTVLELTDTTNPGPFFFFFDICFLTFINTSVTVSVMEDLEA